MNKITMTLQVDHLILEALKEDISSEDVTTNSVMKKAVPGEVESDLQRGRDHCRTGNLQPCIYTSGC